MRFAPLAREHTAEALSTLVEIMRNGRGDAVKLAAAEAILDHLHASRHAMLPPPMPVRGCPPPAGADFFPAVE
jgi:hypothetical protein